MSADASAFSCLSPAVRDSLLQQAFQQLDQRHLFGVAPRVCRLWHQLSLSIITSLDAIINSEAAAEQLSYWIQRHGARLISLNLLLKELVPHASAAGSLLQSLQVAKGLRSFSLATSGQAGIDSSLHTLTNLTSLRLRNCYPTTAQLDSILGLTKLSSLSLNGLSGINLGPFLEQLSTSLVGLTRFDLSGTAFYAGADCLVHLHKLPQLKELLTGGAIPVNTLVGMGSLPFTSVGVSVERNTVGEACLWLQNASGRLQKLSLFGHGPQAVPALQLPILQLGQLKDLKASYVSLNMVHVAALTQLTQLALNMCGLDDAAVCSLSPLCNMRVLTLSYNPQITGAQGSMEVLARSMPHLTTLGLYNTSAEAVAQQVFGDRVIGYAGRDCKWDLRPLGGAEVL